MKRYEQSPVDAYCSLMCMLSIYDYFGKPKSLDYFLTKLPFDGENAFLPQLAKLCCRDGIVAEIVVSNPYIFDLSWRGLPNSVLIEKLGQRFLCMSENRWRRNLTEYSLFLQEGGKVRQEIIDEVLIRNALEKRKLVLAQVNNVLFHQRTRFYWDDTALTYEPNDVAGGSEGHSIIVNGWSSKKGFHIVDSATLQGYSVAGQFWVKPSLLIAAIYTQGGEIGLIG